MLCDYNMKATASYEDAVISFAAWKDFLDECENIFKSFIENIEN